MSNFSLRSRPFRNSFRASSEAVVTGILSAAPGSVLVATELLLLSATFAQPMKLTVAAKIRESNRRIDLLRDIGFLLRVFAQEDESRLAFRDLGRRQNHLR
jgi:hypothetical protein